MKITLLTGVATIVFSCALSVSASADGKKGKGCNHQSSHRSHHHHGGRGKSKGWAHGKGKPNVHACASRPAVHTVVRAPIEIPIQQTYTVPVYTSPAYTNPIPQTTTTYTRPEPVTAQEESPFYYNEPAVEEYPVYVPSHTAQNPTIVKASAGGTGGVFQYLGGWIRSF